MGLTATLRYILDHRLNRGHKARALGRFVSWQVASRLWRGKKLTVPFVGTSKLLVARGMTGATGNVYGGLAEFEDMAFLLHLLREGDTFLDVGANIGAYTVLASAVCRARTLAFEPAPAAYGHLLDNVRLNAIDGLVEAHRVGLGREAGTLRFTADLDTMNHVAGDGEIGDGADATVEVPIRSLDEFAARPALLKIDVEGFETNVIAGAARTLQSEQLLAVIMEHGNGGRYGFDESALQRTMLEVGFKPFTYAPFEHRLGAAAGLSPSGNTLYVRDAALCARRVEEAPAFTVNRVRV